MILSGLLVLMIACEGISVSAWEMLLVSHRTALLGMRQGLFFPLRILCAAAGSFLAGVEGAMGGWTVVALVQCIWLRSLLGLLWNPFKLWPILWSPLNQLLRRGLPFYGANLLASMIFYPLFLKVASGTGLADIGYLRVGQILQQLFAFMPSTLVPILFLRLRGEPRFADQVAGMERPLRIIWFLLLEALLLYCLFDNLLIDRLFGTDFASAVLPTRLLLLTALFESLAQLVVQPLLASGQTRLYGFWQNCSAALAAVIGWIWIPTVGLAAYLIVRLIYVVVPLIGFAVPVARRMIELPEMFVLTFVSVALTILFIVQILSLNPFSHLTSLLSATGFVSLLVARRHDAIYLGKMLMRTK